MGEQVETEDFRTNLYSRRNRKLAEKRCKKDNRNSKCANKRIGGIGKDGRL